MFECGRDRDARLEYDDNLSSAWAGMRSRFRGFASWSGGSSASGDSDRVGTAFVSMPGGDGDDDLEVAMMVCIARLGAARSHFSAGGRD